MLRSKQGQDEHERRHYTKAAAVLDKVIAAHSLAAHPAPLQLLASEMFTCLAYNRSLVYKNPEISEEAIFRFRTLLGCSSLPDSIHVDVSASPSSWQPQLNGVYLFP